MHISQNRNLNMSTINYNFLEIELLESMLENLKNEDQHKEIICEQVSILAAFNVINAEQIRQLSYFTHYDDYKCYATYFYAIQDKHNKAEIIKIRSKTLADELIELEKQENFANRASFSEADFKASASEDRDRSNDDSIIFILSQNLLYAIDDYFISKDFIDSNCIVSRKKAINTVRRKLLNQILQVHPSAISNRAYQYSLRKFEHHFAHNENVADSIKLFLYRSAETNTYQQFIDIISQNNLEDTEFNRARFKEIVQILVILQRINTAQVIQLCAQSFDKPDCLPISMLSLQAAMDISLNIELEITHMEDQDRNELFSLDDFEAAARQKIDESHDLGFYEFAFGILEMSFLEMLEFKRTHNEDFDLEDYHRLLTLLRVRKLSFKDFAALKLEFDF